MSTTSRLGLVALLASQLVACSSFVEGNGVFAERVFDAASGDLRPFDGAVIGFPSGVDTSGQPLTTSLYLVDPASQARQVVLSGDENVIQHIHPRVDADGTLRTTIDVDGYSSVHPPQLRVRATELVAIESVGGADIAVLGAATSHFTVTASAAGRVTLSGAGGEALTVVLSGGSSLDASAYPVSTAEVALTSASSALVWPSAAPSGSLSGGSALLVKGAAGCGAVVTDARSTCGPG